MYRGGEAYLDALTLHHFLAVLVEVGDNLVDGKLQKEDVFGKAKECDSDLKRPPESTLHLPATSLVDTECDSDLKGPPESTLHLPATTVWWTPNLRTISAKHLAKHTHTQTRTHTHTTQHTHTHTHTHKHTHTHTPAAYCRTH